jgi:hypothetical protein
MAKKSIDKASRDYEGFGIHTQEQSTPYHLKLKSLSLLFLMPCAIIL